MFSERFGGAPVFGAIVSVVEQAEIVIGRFAGSRPLSLLLTSEAWPSLGFSVSVSCELSPGSTLPSPLLSAEVVTVTLGGGPAL